MSRAEPVQTAEAGGHPYRAAGIRAQGEVNQPPGYRRGGAARRPTADVSGRTRIKGVP